MSDPSPRVSQQLRQAADQKVREAVHYDCLGDRQRAQHAMRDSYALRQQSNWYESQGN